MKPEPILGFFGPYRFLSNFHFVDVEYDGEIYRTTEHAYQAAKTLDLDARRMIQRMSAPKDARRAGQSVQLRDGWHEGLKWDVMYDLSCQKYSKEPLMSMLLDTGTAYLEETNTWGDRYWGVCGTGENQLGKILMAIREDLTTMIGAER